MLSTVKERKVVSETAELIDRCMRDLDADANVVRACLQQATEDDLKKYGFDYYFINLLAAFKGRMSREQLRALAAKATVSKLWGGWEYYSYLTKLPERAAIDVQTNGTRVKLKGWDLELIQRLLDHGKGLILCSHHHGAYRYLQTDLALLGLKVTIPFDREAYLQTTGSLELARTALRQFPDAELEQMLDSITPVNVEEKRGMAEILKALERGEVVLIFADGNTGLDGPLGNKSRSEIDFFDFRIAVKNGIPRMAALVNAPLLPVLALGTRQVVFGEPIIPPDESSDPEFVQETMQTLYRFLEDHAREDPEQWQSCCFLHRWRAAAQDGDRSRTSDITADRSEIIKLIKRGACLKLDRDRAVIVDTDREPVLVDVKTLKFYGNLSWAGDLLRALFDSGGLGPGWMNSQRVDDVRKEKYLNLLAHLKSTDLLQCVSL